MDGLEDMEMDLSSLLEDFPPDLSSGGDTDMVASPLGDLFSPLGEGFHPKALAELLEVENQMLDDQGWLWEDGVLETAMAMDTPRYHPTAAASLPRMKAFTETVLVPTKQHNLSKLLCPDFTYSPALSRPAMVGSQIVFGTQFVLRGQQNKVVLWDLQQSTEPQQTIDVREPAHAFVPLEQESRVAFACGSSIGMMMQTGQSFAQRPFYAPEFHEAPIRDLELCPLGRQSKVISGGMDGRVFVSDLEHLLSNAKEKHNWCAKLGTSISSVAYHPRHSELVSVTTDCGVLFTKDLRESREFIQRLEPRRGTQAHLFDQLWSEDGREIILGYSDGVIIKSNMENNAYQGGTMRMMSDPRLVELDSLSHLGRARIGSFGNGGMTCYDTQQPGDLINIATFVPETKSFLGHGGCYDPRRSGMVITSADASIFYFNNCFPQ